ncbi:MAG: hypothetical protein WC101_03065 [Candidatus Gracilibacteria bacterium]
MSLEKIAEEIDQLKDRNKRVDINKAWETSKTRKALILMLTYIVVVIFFFVAHLPNPFINAIVPSLGFFLSTLSVSVVKGWWMKNIYKN